MKPYKSISGKQSGVTGYSVGDNYILVAFGRKGFYRYSYASAGERHVEHMKELAVRQQGLSTYISQHHPGYE